MRSGSLPSPSPCYMSTSGTSQAVPQRHNSNLKYVAFLALGSFLGACVLSTFLASQFNASKEGGRVSSQLLQTINGLVNHYFC